MPVSVRAGVIDRVRPLLVPPREEGEVEGGCVWWKEKGEVPFVLACVPGLLSLKWDIVVGLLLV
jgi:hypothetical protein